MFGYLEERSRTGSVLVFGARTSGVGGGLLYAGTNNTPPVFRNNEVTWRKRRNFKFVIFAIIIYVLKRIYIERTDHYREQNENRENSSGTIYYTSHIYKPRLTSEMNRTVRYVGGIPVLWLKPYIISCTIWYSTVVDNIRNNIISPTYNCTVQILYNNIPSLFVQNVIILFLETIIFIDRVIFYIKLEHGILFITIDLWSRLF